MSGSWIWIVAGLAVWGGLHSLLASLKAKAWARRSLGPLAGRLYRLIYNLFAGVSFLPILALLARLPDRRLYAPAFPWNLPLLFGQALGLVGLAVGFLQSRPMEFLGICQLGSPIEEPGRLSVEGLYRFVRHPLYTAGLLLIWLLPVMTVNLLVTNLALTAYIVIGAHFEEAKLVKEFGSAYREYQRRTPMFVPLLKGWPPRQDLST